MKIRPLSKEHPQVKTFIEELDALNLELYPNGPNYLCPAEKLDTILGLYSGDELKGMGALMKKTDYAEVKRVYIDSSQRGKGYSKLLMKALEEEAVGQGIKVLRLETGILQKAALGLYEALGYKRIDAFGEYYTHELSVFFEKNLFAV
ncbi:MAG: putative acetyltransferase [Bacteriovoracaceae bacterium]|jgi:putative acetyltransferase